MMDNTCIELAALLPPDSLERLQEEAQREHLQLPALVREIIELYLEELDEVDDEYTSDEQIRSDVQLAWREAMIGQTRPTREAIEEIRRELTGH